MEKLPRHPALGVIYNWHDSIIRFTPCCAGVHPHARAGTSGAPDHPRPPHCSHRSPHRRRAEPVARHDAGMARRNPRGPAARAPVRHPPDRPAPVFRPAGPSAVMAGRALCPGHVGRTGLRIPSARQHGVSVPSVTQSPAQPGAARTVGCRVRSATRSQDAETAPIAWRYRPEALCAAPRPDPRSWTTPGIRTVGFWPACGVRSSAAPSGYPKERNSSFRLSLPISFRYQN